MKAVYEDFLKIRASFAGREQAFSPKEALREVLGREEHRLATQVDLSGPGPWRLGQNRHGREVAVVFLSHVELHKHARSRTDQFPIYVVGEAEGFSIGADGAACSDAGDRRRSIPEHAGRAACVRAESGEACPRELGDRFHCDYAT